MATGKVAVRNTFPIMDMVRWFTSDLPAEIPRAMSGKLNFRMVSGVHSVKFSV